MAHVMLVRAEIGEDGPTGLTLEQKLYALATKFYSFQPWTPREGDYYTSSRADLELYQVVKVGSGRVSTRYCDGSFGTGVSEWDEALFTTEGFGPCRVHVPGWVIRETPPGDAG
jgi:hypothetical protein